MKADIDKKNNDNAEELLQKISELKKANEEILRARKAALNIMEDAILAKEALHESQAQLAEELENTKVLQQVSAQMIKAENVDLLYEKIMEASRSFTKSEMASVQMFVAEKNMLKLIACKGFHSESVKLWKWMPAGATSVYGVAFAQNKRVIVPDIEEWKFIKDSKDLSVFHISGIRAIQSTPLITRSGKVIGLLSNYWTKVYTPSDRELGFIDILCRQTADLIERVSSEQALRQREEQLKQLNASLEAQIAARTKELKEQARFITQVTDTVPDMISIMESSSRKFHYINKDTFTAHGFDPSWMEQLPKEEVGEIIYKDDRIALDNYFNSFANLTDGEIVTAEYRAKNFFGNWLWFKVRGVVFQRDAAGNAAYILNIIQNITEQKKAEEKVNELNKELSIKNRELETANSELRTFASVAASDYKETLKHLYTLLEFVATNDARNFSNAGKANVRRAQSAIQKLKLLTDDILSYSEIQPAEIDAATVDLNDILKGAQQKLNRRIEETNATIHSDKLPRIDGYPNLLLLLFCHLLDNAIKFRKEKTTPVIQIEYSQAKGTVIEHADVNPRLQYHVISITDNGIGIQNEHIEKIFEMFFTGHEKGKYKGSGIGLAICKKVMDVHHGFISAEPSPGNNGTTFSCVFPLQKSPPPRKLRRKNTF